MSASRLVTIMCDHKGCGQWVDAGIADTAGRARAQLKPLGWRVGDRNGWDRLTRDYCPAHAAQHR